MAASSSTSSSSSSNASSIEYVCSTRCRVVIDGTKLIVQLSPCDRVLIDTPSKILFSTPSIKLEHPSANQVYVSPSFPPNLLYAYKQPHNDESSNCSAPTNVPQSDSSLASYYTSPGSELLSPLTSLSRFAESPLSMSNVIYEAPPPMVVIDSCGIGQKFYPINLEEYGTVYTKEGASHVLIITGASNAINFQLEAGAPPRAGVIAGAVAGIGPDVAAGGAAAGDNRQCSNSNEMKRTKVRSRALPYKCCNKFESATSTSMTATGIGTCGEISNSGNNSTNENVSNNAFNNRSCNSGNRVRNRITGSKQYHDGVWLGNYCVDKDTLSDRHKATEQQASLVETVTTGDVANKYNECIFLRCDESLVRYRLRDTNDRIELHSGKIVAWTLGVRFEYKTICCMKSVVAVHGQPSGTVWIHNPRPKHLYQGQNTGSI